MLDQTEASIISNGRVGQPFKVGGGLREGCVCSPLLWAAYADALVTQIDAIPPSDDDVRVGSRTMRIAIYADDIVLIARTPERLQRLVSEYQRWAQRFRVTVSREKSLCMVLRAPWDHEMSYLDSDRLRCDRGKTLDAWSQIHVGDRPIQILYAGTPIRFVKRMRYLGVFIEDIRPLQMAGQTAMKSFRASMQMVKGVIRTVGIRRIPDQWAFFRAMLVSKLTFAAVAWQDSYVIEELDKSVYDFARWTAGARRKAFRDGILTCVGPPWGKPTDDIFASRIRHLAKMLAASADQDMFLSAILEGSFWYAQEGTENWLVDLESMCRSRGITLGLHAVRSHYRNQAGHAASHWIIRSELLQPPHRFRPHGSNARRFKGWAAQVLGRETSWFELDSRVRAESLNDSTRGWEMARRIDRIQTQCVSPCSHGFFLRMWTVALRDGWGGWWPHELVEPITSAPDRRNPARLCAGESRLGRSQANKNCRSAYADLSDEDTYSLHRSCLLCVFNRGVKTLEDEFHVLFECPEYRYIQQQWGEKWRSITGKTYQWGIQSGWNIFMDVWRKREGDTGVRCRILIGELVSRILSQRLLRIREFMNNRNLVQSHRDLDQSDSSSDGSVATLDGESDVCEELGEGYCPEIHLPINFDKKAPGYLRVVGADAPHSPSHSSSIGARDHQLDSDMNPSDSSPSSSADTTSESTPFSIGSPASESSKSSEDLRTHASHAKGGTRMRKALIITQEELLGEDDVSRRDACTENIASHRDGDPPERLANQFSRVQPTKPEQRVNAQAPITQSQGMVPHISLACPSMGAAREDPSVTTHARRAAAEIPISQNERLGTSQATPDTDMRSSSQSQSSHDWGFTAWCLFPGNLERSELQIRELIHGVPRANEPCTRDPTPQTPDTGAASMGGSCPSTAQASVTESQFSSGSDISGWERRKVAAIRELNISASYVAYETDIIARGSAIRRRSRDILQANSDLASTLLSSKPPAIAPLYRDRYGRGSGRGVHGSSRDSLSRDMGIADDISRANWAREVREDTIRRF